MRTMASVVSNEVEEIRRRMAQIRREMHEDVQGVVASAETATDWRSYVRSYPWLSLGLAVAAGFLIVPRRPPTVVPPVAMPVESQDRVAQRERRAGLLGAMAGMVVPVLTRAAQAYASHWLENWIAQQTRAGPQGSESPYGPPGGAFGPGD
jgi:hypothetical protein